MFQGHVERFLASHPANVDRGVEQASNGSIIDAETRNAIGDRGVIAHEPGDLMAELPKRADTLNRSTGMIEE